MATNGEQQVEISAEQAKVAESILKSAKVTHAAAFKESKNDGCKVFGETKDGTRVIASIIAPKGKNLGIRENILGKVARGAAATKGLTMADLMAALAQLQAQSAKDSDA